MSDILIIDKIFDEHEAQLKAKDKRIAELEKKGDDNENILFSESHKPND